MSSAVIPADIVDATKVAEPHSGSEGVFMGWSLSC